MNKLLSLALVCVIGCGGSAPAPMDDSDAGTISIPDAGPQDAALISPDASAPCEITVSQTQWDGLQSQCLPRCSADTYRIAYACADANCFWPALDQDTTPESIVIVNGREEPLNCYTCVSIQYKHCAAVAGCAMEYYVSAVCDPSVDPDRCQGEYDAGNACIRAHMSAFNACYGLAADACFE